MTDRSTVPNRNRLIIALLSTSLVTALSGCSVSVNPKPEETPQTTPVPESAMVQDLTETEYEIVEEEFLKIKSGEVAPEDYAETKEELLEIQERIAFDELNDKEDKLETLFEQYKETADGFYTPDMIYGVLDGNNETVMNSDLYRFCLDLPKGADLHDHNYYGVPKDRFLKLISEYPGVRIVLDQKAEDYGCLYGPKAEDTPDYAVLLSQALTDGRIRLSDLRQMLSLKDKNDPRLEWTDMNRMMKSLGYLLADPDLAVKIYEESLRSYCEHNVSLLEVRMVFKNGDDDANIAKLQPFIQAYRNIKTEYPDFKLRFIASSAKGYSMKKEDALAALDSAIRIKDRVMDDTQDKPSSMIIGLDLVNEEDAGNPLGDYAEYFNSEKTKNSGLHYFFHCGESLRIDNDSVVDAYLLGADRVGHGFNLYRFPDVMQLYKDEGITLEICPMSNLRLGYVPDLRLHPALSYLRSGVKVSLCSDDALFMVENPLVDDFYAAIMNWDLTLADIKMLCRNSLEASGLPDDERQELLEKWDKDWDAFVDKELSH